MVIPIKIIIIGVTIDFTEIIYVMSFMKHYLATHGILSVSRYIKLRRLIINSHYISSEYNAAQF